MARPIARAFGQSIPVSGPDKSRPRPHLQAPSPVVGLRFAFPRPTLADVHVVNDDGLRVRTLACGELAAGEHDCRWDGLDEGGFPCAAGRYVLRLETAGNLLTSRVVLLA
jgi:hypothetical protein